VVAKGELILLGVNSNSSQYWKSKYIDPTEKDSKISGDMILSNGTVLSNHSMYIHNNNRVIGELRDAGFGNIQLNETDDEYRRFAIFTANKII
jgi:hypothetical protein